MSQEDSQRKRGRRNPTLDLAQTVHDLDARSHQRRSQSMLGQQQRQRKPSLHPNEEPAEQPHLLETDAFRAPQDD